MAALKKDDRIGTDEDLYRRGYNSPQKKYLNPDGSATSRVFKLRPKDEGKLSVDLVKLTTKEAAVLDASKYNLFLINNSVVESIDLFTVYDPLDEPDIVSHCLIFGLDQEDDIKPAFLAKKAVKVYPMWPI
ncbi:hypothetical protein MASR1M65_18630 [Saprospiraceae bacterium]